ncbi:DUF3300 domain-containing protein [Xanthobacter sediminis]|uniref:DUF3300 domain-containing protein n=1 Tax=Xanthobacter sediminis TaxID=3119926 RepID=UPI00372A9613
MTSPVRRKGPPAWAGNWSRIAVAAVFGWSAALGPALAQTAAGEPTQPGAPAAAQTPISPAPISPTPAPEAVPPAPAATAMPPVPTQVPAPVPAAADQAPAADLYTLAELEYLLAPVALYPDPLLAILLPAAAFPDQIVEAHGWVERNPNTARTGSLSALDDKPWDASVKALTRFPDVLRQLYQHMEWTESLGYAFIHQPQDVSTVVQMLRAQAEKVGNLASTPQQVVTTREDAGQRTIYIQPANPERIYVPVYNPSSAFDTFAVGALGFGAGVLVGSAWNNRWGWNNRGWNTIWAPPPAWHRPPHWGWGPGPGPRPRPPTWGPGPWQPRPPHVNRPGRPNPPAMRPPTRPGGGTWTGNRPGTPPGGGRPIINRPEININQPGNSGTIINRPGTRPDINRPNFNRPDGNRPNINRPNINRPENRPGANRPNVNRPNVSRPENRPNVNRPVNRPNAGQHRPVNRAQVQQRAQQRAGAQHNVRQRQQARPQQHHARPRAGGGHGRR